jgi:DNA gyrase/topoisomerase IV subunit B
MIRTILKSNQNNLTLTLPDDLVGKLIEVIAFEIKENDAETQLTNKKLKPSQLRGFLSKKSADSMHEHINQSRAEWDTL